MKKIILSMVSFIIISTLLFTNISAECPVMNWYCKRAANNNQPLADTNMQFIEKYNGYYIDHIHDDNNNDKVLYLTFDAGYENGNVSIILDALKRQEW